MTTFVASKERKTSRSRAFSPDVGGFPARNETSDERSEIRRRLTMTDTGSTLNTDSAQAKKEPLLPTPDWRTLSPTVSTTDLFTEQTGYNDADVTGWDGRNVYGVTIGLVQMHVNLAMIPGNMGNATTFDFPILYRRMNA
jgi:hypothetical protein